MKPGMLPMLALAVLITFISGCRKEILSDVNSGLRIEFSNGTVLTQNDIAFYDSSTHLFFFKNNLPDQKFTSFKVKVDNEEIYDGMYHSCELSSPPKSAIYITGCFLYGPNIIEIGAYNDHKHVLNDPRIIQYLESKNLLRAGITCSIRNITVSTTGSNSMVTCTVRLKNHDPNSYLIPDPIRMGESKFSYYSGGLNFFNTETKTSSFLKWTAQMSDWYTVTLSDFSVLSGGSEMDLTFSSSDYLKIDKGIYNIRFVFPGLRYNAPSFNLNQKQGRIWVGESVVQLENYVVE